MKENNGGKMTDDELDELCIFWWGSDTDERTITEVIECGSMAAFAHYVLENFANQHND